MWEISRVRLFVAISLPERVKDTLTALCGGIDGAREGAIYTVEADYALEGP